MTDVQATTASAEAVKVRLLLLCVVLAFVEKIISREI
jgi:hypothetical protein